MELQHYIDESHRIAVDHGWWGGLANQGEYDDRNLGEQIALMHSELSEALEEYRSAKPPFYHENGKPEGIVTEFADVLIRIFDTCRRYGWDLELALQVKMKYNEGRPYRHGGKLA